ncbi:M6 family metalloprotease domain-containing protein [bacterium]
MIFLKFFVQNRFILLLVFFALNAAYLFAVAPPNPDVYDVGFRLKSDKSFKTQSKLKKVPKLTRRKITAHNLQLTGSAKPVVILIEFQDTTHSASNTTTFFQNLVFANSGLSMNTYYKENSGNVFSIVNADAASNPSAWVKSGSNMSRYGNPEGQNQDASDIWLLALEAVQLADSQIDFSKYANANDEVDYFIVVHAGAAEESSESESDIWSHAWEIAGGYTTDDDGASGKVRVKNYIMLSEYSPLGIFCHEFGHALGLPDFYNTDTGESTVWTWDLMDFGSWLDWGTRPSHLSAWNKLKLGWGNVATLTDDGVLDISPNEDMLTSNNNFVKLPILGSAKEYFLLEYRRKSTDYLFDRGLYNEGVLIWHIDDNVNDLLLIDNEINNLNIKGVDLVEADDIGSLSTQVDDVWLKGSVFTVPRSNSNQNVPSGINVDIVDIISTGSNPRAILTFKLLAFRNEVLIKTIYSFPNPTRGASTIRSILTKPAADGYLKIFNIAGEEVYAKDIGYENFVVGDSKDYESHYIFQWDGKNHSGNDVASGVYIYILKADEVIKKGKICVVR